MGDTENSDELQPDDIKGVAGNFINAMRQWKNAGRPIVSKQEWDTRLTICRSCEWWQEIAKTKLARCKKCGCSSAKLLLGTSRCPLNPPKWAEASKK